MIINFPKINITEHEKLWLETVYELSEPERSFMADIRKVKIKLLNKIDINFDPSKIDQRLLQYKTMITLLGLLHIEPDSYVIDDFDMVVKKIQKMIKKEPTLSVFSESTIKYQHISSQEYSLIFNFLRQFDIGSSSIGSGDDPNVSFSSDKYFDFFIKYENVEKLLQEFYDQYEKKRIVKSNVNNELSKRDVKQFEYDCFISHASEDKEDFVRPLANKLKNAGFNVWFDETEIDYGESIRRKIDEGLKKSRFGIVIFSETFFLKEWPQYELDGLIEREMNKQKVIIPIWHKITKEQMFNYSPSLTDIKALNSMFMSFDEIVDGLSKLF